MYQGWRGRLQIFLSGVRFTTPLPILVLLGVTVAQFGRASVCETDMRGFKSHQSPLIVLFKFREENLMNVGDLKEMLKQYPDDMEILNGRYSDYSLIKEDEWSVVRGVKKEEWVMRSHPRMSDENKANEKEYLYLEGN